MITLHNVKKQFGTKIVYNNISASINPGRRIGLIGLNGSGKTILLRMLAGKEKPDSGEVNIPNDLKLAYLPQEMSFEQNVSPLNFVLQPFKHLFEIEKVLEELALCKDNESSEYKKYLKKYENLQTEMHIHDVYSIDSSAKRILTGLGVPEDSWAQSMSLLSGGYKMRVLLARLLLIKPDFLLLDEPTNHLDMDSLIWLEKYLQTFKGGMLIVSHDRDFLNRLVIETIEILNGSINQYTGNVNDYFKWREEICRTEEKRRKNIQNKIEKTERFIERFKAKNTKASAARSKMKQLDRLKIEMPEKETGVKSIHFEFQVSQRSGSVPLTFENVKIGYDNNIVFDKMNLVISREDKIAIIGPNGSGKSTFLKACFGFVKPKSGEIKKGYNTTLRYYSQHRLEQLDLDKNLYDSVAGVSVKQEKTYIQSLLGAFLFTGDEIDKKVGVLSGGEKSRISLAMMLADPGNVLLLDEPTNHLDIQSVEMLANALHKFQGTVIFVSHDELFISRIANRILEFRPGMFRDFPGTLTDYRSYIEEGYLESFSMNENRGKKGYPVSENKQERMYLRKERKKLERRIKKIETQVSDIENEITDLKEVLYDSDNAADYGMLNKVREKIDRRLKHCNILLHEWEELQYEYESGKYKY